MFKRFITFTLLFSIIVGIFAGCSDFSGKKNAKAIITSDLIKYHTTGANDFGFNINLLTTKKNPDVEFIKFTGTNTQGLAVTYQNDTYDELIDKRYNGYYVTIMGFVCHTGDAFVQIDGMTLSVNGEEYDVDFKLPIIHMVYPESTESTNKVEAGSYPLFVSTKGISNTEFTYEYHISDSISIENFGYNDFLAPENDKVFLNGSYIGNMDDTFPLEVKNGDTVTIQCTMAFDGVVPSTQYDSVYCDTILTYVDAGVEKELKNGIVCQSISNLDDAENVINLALGK